jgi:hypothetical protein
MDSSSPGLLRLRAIGGSQQRADFRRPATAAQLSCGLAEDGMVTTSAGTIAGGSVRDQYALAQASERADCLPRPPLRSTTSANNGALCRPHSAFSSDVIATTASMLAAPPNTGRCQGRAGRAGPGAMVQGRRRRGNLSREHRIRRPARAVGGHKRRPDAPGICRVELRLSIAEHRATSMLAPMPLSIRTPAGGSSRGLQSMSPGESRGTGVRQ